MCVCVFVVVVVGGGEESSREAISPTFFLSHWVVSAFLSISSKVDIKNTLRHSEYIVLMGSVKHLLP